MKKFRLLKGFTPFEIGLYLTSLVCITLSFVLFHNQNYWTLAASLLGATSLILIAKGLPVGQAICIVFALLYGYISFRCRYYGELITYVGMSLPISVYSLVSWIKHPYRGKGAKGEVKVESLTAKTYLIIFGLAVAVTVAFYFILRALDTANLIWSTLSVLTSFLAVALAARRCPFYALAYAANDIVLILLWTLMSLNNTEYVSMVVCFVVFLANDIYGFVQWTKRKKHQAAEEEQKEE